MDKRKEDRMDAILGVLRILRELKVVDMKAAQEIVMRHVLEYFDSKRVDLQKLSKVKNR